LGSGPNFREARFALRNIVFDVEVVAKDRARMNEISSLRDIVLGA